MPTIPDHVPRDLVFDYSFSSRPGVEVCPFEANSVVHELPDIYFSVSQDDARSFCWVVTSSVIAREVYTRPDAFSSKGVAGFLRLLGKDLDLIPAEIDPPAHGPYRILVSKIFSPKRLQFVEKELRNRARLMVSDLVQKKSFDFEKEFGRLFPARSFLDLMDLPQDRLEDLVTWVDMLLHSGQIETVLKGAQHFQAFLEEIVPQRKSRPGSDIISEIVTSQIESRPITDDEILSICFLLLFAGLDNIAATMDYIFKYLAEHPIEQKELRENPERIPIAMEELLRAYTVAFSPRIVAKDMVFHGVKMKCGDRLLIATALTGRDPDAYHRPNCIEFERPEKTHLAFGAGPHMCLGARFARMELQIALETWLEMAPPFKISPKEQAETRAKGVFDVVRLPLVFE